MGLDNRVHYRRRKSYNTASNKVKIVKTPGNKHVVQYLGKKGSVPYTPTYLGHKAIPGVQATTPGEKSRLAKSKRTVNRAYGGVLTHDIVREKIIRAFLVEEQKIVKRVLKMKKEGEEKQE